MSEKTLILGVGNTILRDDAAGIVVAKKICETVNSPCVEFAEASYAGWRLIDLLSGYGKAVIIDSIVDPRCLPGTCCRVELSDRSASRLRSTHGLGLEEAVALAKQSGYRMPDTVSLYAVGAVNTTEFGEALSADVERGVPEIVRQIIDEEKLHA